MVMKVTSCLLLKMDGQSAPKLEGTIQALFPETEFTIVHSIDEALNHPEASGLELLAISDPDKAILERAIATLDSGGLARWAVIVLGGALEEGRVTAIRPDKWEDERIASELRCAVARHQLLRENARLRGDLLTIASRVTHDLRSPLGAIVNSGEMLKDIASEIIPGNAALTAPLFDSVDDLGRLIGRVSQLTKATANPPPKQQIAMEEVIWLALQRQEREILKRRAILVRAERWPEVEGVSSWLEGIWVNLLDNSLKHGRDGIHIELGWNRQGDEYRFWANDDGDGILPEKVANLFQPFHLLHKLDSRKGLGLSIVQRLVELQEGQCGYLPRPGGGSCFYFTLPANQNSTSKRSRESAKQAGPFVRG